MNDKLRKAFEIAFKWSEDTNLSSDLSPEMVSNWDSLGHLRLVNALQEQFGLEFTIDEIMAMENVGAIMKILQAREVER